MEPNLSEKSLFDLIKKVMSREKPIVEFLPNGTVLCNGMVVSQDYLKELIDKMLKDANNQLPRL